MKHYLHNIFYSIFPTWVPAPIHMIEKQPTKLDVLADKIADADNQRILAVVNSIMVQGEVKKMEYVAQSLEQLYHKEVETNLTE